MIARALVRRLKELEDMVVPADAPEEFVRVHSVAPDGKIVKTVDVKIGFGRPTKTLSRRSRLSLRWG